jgi:hypothetical protein
MGGVFMGLEQYKQLLKTRKIDPKFFDNESIIGSLSGYNEKAERLRAMKFQDMTEPWFFIREGRV